MTKTKIEWADFTWNPVTGCTKVSDGCRYCYAETMAKRFWGKRKFTDVRIHPSRLNQPLLWRKPRSVFLASMGDLFHEDVPVDFIADVFMVMAEAKQHIFMILTKRPDRMMDWFVLSEQDGYGEFELLVNSDLWPLKNVWLGVSVEDQKTADERITYILQTPAAVRFVNFEPLLGGIDLHGFQPFRQMDKSGFYRTGGILAGKIDWVIVGGESGRNARPMTPDWVRSLRDQCQEAGVPFFFKQWGESYPTRRIINKKPVTVMKKVGKKLAGRLLDSREWNEFPDVG